MLLMRENNLSFEKWALLENIYFLSNNNYHACFASKPTLANYLLISRSQIFKLISELESCGLIIKNELGHLMVTQKWIDLSSDTTSAENTLSVQNLHQNSAKNALPPVQKMHPKRDITKRENKIDKKNIQKSSASHIEKALIIPNSKVDGSLIQSFILYREEKGKPFTQIPLNRFVQKLEELKLQDENIEEIIETAIINGWNDVYSKKKSYVSLRDAKRAKGEALQNTLNQNGYSNIFDILQTRKKA